MSLTVATDADNYSITHQSSSSQQHHPHHQGSRPHSQLGNVTVKLAEVYHGCDPLFCYDRSGNPRRILTKPGRPVHNNGFDNEKWDYILYVNDVIGEEEGRRYVIIDLLGQGTFGQVVKCQNVYTKELVAVKVIKNQPAYYNQSMMEVTVLEMVNNRFDRDDSRHIVRLKDTFVYRGHLCIVVELLSVNLYELVKQNQYRGFSLKLCRIFLAQVLDALCVLKEARIVHCDLKPENILLRSLDKPSIKVIDFGSACHEHQTVYTYIQSRFYRSPEVLLGLPYSSAIDMWSLGCIAVELFLGLPIFPGASNYDQMSRIVESLGHPPFHMLEVGKDTNQYFERYVSADLSRPQYKLKSRDRFSMDQGKPEPPSKRYFASTDLEEIILGYPMRTLDANSGGKEEEEQRQRRCFLHFVRGLLTINPVERWSPLQAISHPFITGHPLESLYGLATATATTTMPISMASRPTSRTRPRANTLATLSLQDVPGPLQKLAAAAQGAAAPPGGPTADYRDIIPDNVSSPTVMVQAASSSSIPVLNDYTGSIDGSNMQSTASPSKKLDNLYTNRYIDNRRISNPALVLQPTGNSNNNRPSNTALIEPFSLPNTTATIYKKYPTNKRRDSMDSMLSATQSAIPNSPLAMLGPDTTTTTSTSTVQRSRRKSVNSIISSPSIDSIDESSGHKD